ncbi:MAG: hypothetical protein EOT04_00365 [Candidatus Chaera renei]|uniref:Phosphoribosyltransferase domain-containing protein n=1 Tax=Candidatus Chaera renei TaxID=2506947 RepID=A0A4Q0AK90_9BACT|nr:MAG: hypothetical protein EOT04_00365 [Candidatus Chaera renei]
MYFKDRSEAGLKLAAQLAPYRYENCVVLALNDGGVLVGEQIAAEIHSVLTILLTEDVTIPGERLLFGSVTQGGFTQNQNLSDSEREEYYGEFHGYIEDQKREQLQRINRLLGDGGLLDEAMLFDHVVILTADGLPDGHLLDVAAGFLKPIRLKRLVVAVPVASVPAVDRMHVLADELHVLSVTDNYLDTNHYYDNNLMPSREETIARLNRVILNWR